MLFWDMFVIPVELLHTQYWRVRNSLARWEVIYNSAKFMENEASGGHLQCLVNGQLKGQLKHWEFVEFCCEN